MCLGFVGYWCLCDDDVDVFFVGCFGDDGWLVVDEFC